MPQTSPRIPRLVALVAALAALAAWAPAHSATLEVTAVDGVDTSRPAGGLTAASTVVLEGGTRLAAGSTIGVGDRIESGTLENTSGENLVISLGGDCLTVLVPGEQITVAAGELVLSTHECVCRCTCSGEGFSKLFSVDAPCDGTANCAALNGSDCLVFVDGELKEGTASGCAFKIVPKAATAAAAATATQ